MENNEETFSYTYSAAQQAEIERIRKKYLPPEEDKMAQVRRLDRAASQKAQAWSIGIGTVGTLLLGIGMSLAMTEFGAALGALALAAGIIVGILGMVLVALAYPTYLRVLKKEQARIAPEILRLTDELMK